MDIDDVNNVSGISTLSLIPSRITKVFASKKVLFVSMSAGIIASAQAFSRSSCSFFFCRSNSSLYRFSFNSFCSSSICCNSSTVYPRRGKIYSDNSPSIIFCAATGISANPSIHRVDPAFVSAINVSTTNGSSPFP